MCWWLSCLRVVSFFVHGEDVHDSVAIGEEVDAAVPEHRVGGSAGPVRSQGNGFIVAVELPDAFGGAALVALGLAGLLEPAGEKEVVVVGRVRSFSSLGQWDDLPGANAAHEDESGLPARLHSARS